MNRNLRWALGFVLVAASLSGNARACFLRSTQPVQVWLDHIDVVVIDGVATKTYHCTFLNPNPRIAAEGTCYMELEPGAQIDGMSVVVNGAESKAEVLDVTKANEVFADIVKSGGTPALLEYYGNQLIQTRVPKIAPNGTVTVKLQYRMVLPERGGLVRMQMLNTNPKALQQPLKSASVRVAIKSQRPVKNVYSPTHTLKFIEKPDYDIVVEWSQDNYLPKHPFVLYYQLGEAKVGAALLAHRELGEEGYFMLMLSPTMGGGAGKLTEQDVLPKDIVFCVDTSGSMLQNNKMEQAQAALRYCIAKLRPRDRFNLVDFGTAVRRFDMNALVPATPENIARALRYVEQLSARGGTAIDDALALSLAMLKPEVSDKPPVGEPMKMIVFATDGLPTIGEREPESILKNVAKRNEHHVRMFVFGEGFDVNSRLLDFLAIEHRGESEYILPEEKIEQKVAAFFDRIGSPIMTDVAVNIEGMPTRDVLPMQNPDLFRGEPLILYGRYSGSGLKKVVITGQVNGRRETLEYQVDFPEVSVDDKNAFVPRLWAGKQVDHLLNEIRKSPDKPNPKLIEEVTLLARRFGILTPYTSFLMTPDVMLKTADVQKREFEQRLRGAPGGLLSTPWGDAAIANACQQARNRRQYASNGGASAMYEQVDQALKQEGRKDGAMSVVQYVGNRTFYQAANRWYDSRYQADQKVAMQNVRVGSPQFLKLLRDHPELSRCMALGNVVVELRGVWYSFDVPEPVSKS